MKKDTSELLKELASCESFTSFYNENEDCMVSGSLCAYLAELLESKGIKKADAIRKSELSEVYAYQIFSGLRIPERKKLLSLAVGMGLTLSEVQTLLKHCSYAPLYAKCPFDCIVIYGICREMTVMDINSLLYEYGEETLG